LQKFKNKEEIVFVLAPQDSLDCSVIVMEYNVMEILNGKQD
jgi:hypothetical protein